MGLNVSLTTFSSELDQKYNILLNITWLFIYRYSKFYSLTLT